MDILAIRGQENLAHVHQTAAAAKPLNQSVRGFVPKTPNLSRNIANGGKTVRNRQREDENAAPAGKTAKAGKTGKTSFVTPPAVKERAPLGLKTTNAKAKAFQTPAPLTVGNGFQKTQQRTTSARKAKLKVHKPQVEQAEVALQLDDDEEEPEIEYCPPKITELPDYEDDPLDLKSLTPDMFVRYPFGGGFMSESGNLFRGEDDAAREKRWNEEEDRLEQQLEENARKTFGFNQEPMQHAVPSTTKMKLLLETTQSLPQSRIKSSVAITRPPTDLDPTSAAKALSTVPRPLPRFAQQTASTAAKSGRPPTIASPSTVSPRSAGVAQKTLGYAAGRKVSSTLKEKQRNEQQKVQQKFHHKPSTKHDETSTVEMLETNKSNDNLNGFEQPSWLTAYDIDTGLEDEADNLFGMDSGSMFDSDDWLKAIVDVNFRMPMPT